MNELLPCPFCGETPTVEMGGHVICCYNRKCSVNPEVRDDDADLAPVIWNRRPSGIAQGKITAELMNATTVSCTGNEITIFCNDHDTKDALMDALTDAAYAPPSTEAPAQGASMLWCCHVRGPDDVYAAPDYETALAWSDLLNAMNWRGDQRYPKPLNYKNPTSFEDCLIKATPAPWPHSPESHAEDMPKSVAGFAEPSPIPSPVTETGGGGSQTPSTERWTEAEIAEAKVEAERLHSYFHPVCQCEYPLIKCDAHGCRCTSCGLMEGGPSLSRPERGNTP